MGEIAEIVHDSTRQIAGKNGGTLTPFTPANARAMQARGAQARRNKAMQAARNRTAARLAASDPTIGTWVDAWGEMVADQAEALRQAASEGKPRGDDLHRIGQAMGAIPLPHEAREQEPGGTVTNILAIGTDAADRLLDALQRVVSVPAQDVD